LAIDPLPKAVGNLSSINWHNDTPSVQFIFHRNFPTGIEQGAFTLTQSISIHRIAAAEINWIRIRCRGKHQRVMLAPNVSAWCRDCLVGNDMAEKGHNPVDSLVGGRIRLLRKQRKMSQSDLGKALGVTFQQIQKYENGKNQVGACRLHLVATALNVPIAELFDGASETGRTLNATKTLAFDSQALWIAEAFIKISNKELRSSLVDLAEAMARKFGSRPV
jgi:transcriptional regulator with XRE-family HTH domain